jgi:hypothetical protein
MNWEPRIVEVDGLAIRRCGSGDRYYVRIEVLPTRFVHLYFADMLHLPELTRVDASPDEPNPPMWEHE